MGFRDDERGQPVLIGALLLFAILIVAFASYQAFVVPSQNAEVEFSHSQDIENQFSELSSNVVNAVESADERSTSITLGTQYPARLIALNPPPVSGTIQTSQPENVEIDADGIGDISEVCGMDSDGDTTSQSLIFTPGYNEYSNAEAAIYENTFVSRQFRDGAVYGDQRLVRGNRIDLTLLTGSVSDTRVGPFNLDVNGSHRYRYGETVEDPEITIPSQFAPGVWNDRILGDEVENVRGGGSSDRVELVFEGEYRISCAVAGLNSDPAFTPPTEDETEAQTTFDTQWTADSPVTVPPGEGVDLTAEVVERETGISIDAAAVDFAIGSGIQPDTAELINTDEMTDDGVATVTVDTKDGSDGAEFEVYVTAGDDSDVVTIEIEDDADEGTMAENVEVDSTGEAFGPGQEDARIEFDLRNDGTGEAIITEISVDSTTTEAEFVEDTRGGSDTFEGGEGGFDGRIDIGDGSVELDDTASIDGQSTEPFELGLFRDDQGDALEMSGQSVTITLEFEDGSSGTYDIDID